MKTGQARILFATYQLAKEGLDIPCLDRLVLATPTRNKGIVRPMLCCTMTLWTKRPRSFWCSTSSAGPCTGK